MPLTRPRFTTALSVAVLVTGALATGSVMAASSDGSPSPDSSGAPAADGARIVNVERLDDRTRDLTIESPAVGTAKVRLLLPPAFETRTDERFPVLYLLHGGGGKYTDWTKNTDVATHTAGADVIVAMPEALTSRLDTFLEGGGPDGNGGLPNWERFHVEQLPELLEQDWRAAEERAVGGNSLGGYTAVIYAGRNPDLYQAVGSYSGALGLAIVTGAIEEVGDIVAEVGEFAGGVIDEVLGFEGDAEPEAVKEYKELAQALAEGAGWEDLDPADLLPLLADGATYIAYGNGQPGPLDSDGATDDLLEGWLSGGNDDFLSDLQEDGLPAEVNAYGPGTHSWAYWDRELKASLPSILEALGQSDDSTNEG
jgi:S-formylglutathione hydrolase FrmB